MSLLLVLLSPPGCAVSTLATGGLLCSRRCAAAARRALAWPVDPFNNRSVTSAADPTRDGRSPKGKRPARKKQGPGSSDDIGHPKTVVQQNTRDRIIEEGRQLFRERGYDGVTMQDLAAKVGITAAALYWHFKSKQQILGEIVEGLMLELIHQTGPGQAAAPPAERLRSFVRSHVRFQLAEPEHGALFGASSFGFVQLVASLPDAQRESLKRLEAQHLRNVTRILEEGVAAGDFIVSDVAPVAFAMLAMGEWAVHWFRHDGPMTADEVATLYGDLAVHMVMPWKA